jgi:hypothetical protein
VLACSGVVLEPRLHTECFPLFPVISRRIWHAYGTVLPSVSNVPRQTGTRSARASVDDSQPRWRVR